MRTYCIAQGTLLSDLWWPKWEGNLKKRGYMYTYNRFTLLYSRNEHNIVKQLYSNKKKNKYINKRLFKNRINREHFPNLWDPRSPFSWNIYFLTHQIFTEYLLCTSTVLEARDTAVNEVGRIPVYILVEISNEQTNKIISCRSRRQKETKQVGK